MTEKYKMQYAASEITALCELLADAMRDVVGKEEQKAFVALKHNIALAFALGRATHQNAAIDFGAFFADIEEGARDIYMKLLQEHLAREPYSLLELAKQYESEVTAQPVTFKPRRSRYLETGMMPEKEYIAAGLNQEFDDRPITVEEKARMSK